MKARLAYLWSGLALLAISLVPLGGIRVPILVDLPEQLAVAKLFAEKVQGVSTLNVEISGYYGYRFFPVYATAALRSFAALGLDPALLPSALTAGLVLLNGIVLLWVLKAWTGARNIDASWSLALLPLTCIYASTFYIGFVNFFPAIPFLILALSCAEKWLGSLRPVHLAGFAAALFLVYVCHPFVLVFWFAWAACRMAVLLPIRRALPWPPIVALVAVTGLVVLYHVTQTPSAIGIGNAAVTYSQILDPLPYWLANRVLPFVTGDFFGLERNVYTRLYALAAVALTAGSLVHLVVTKSWSGTPGQLLLTAVLFCIVCSLPNEAAIPTPPLVALAYDLRFASTAPPILMVFTCVYLFDVVALRRGPARIVFSAVCAACVVVCMLHLVQVRQWFQQFDAFARPNMAAIARGGDSVQGRFASKFHADGSYIRHYRCLFRADCVPSDSWFLEMNNLSLFPIRLLP